MVIKEKFLLCLLSVLYYVPSKSVTPAASATTQSWHCVALASGPVVPTRPQAQSHMTITARPPLLLSKSQVQVVNLSIWPTSYQPEVPRTCLGLNTEFKELTGLRRTVYVLNYLIKGYISGRARWKRCTGQDGKGRGAFRPYLGAPPSQHLHTFSSLESVQIL